MPGFDGDVWFMLLCYFVIDLHIHSAGILKCLPDSNC